MSVGKDSILRAANAEAKTTEVKAEPAKTTEEAKAPAEVKEAVKAEAQVKEAEVKKAPAKKPRTTKAKTTTSKTAAKKTAPKKTTTRKKTVKTSVLTPENSEVLEAAFVKEKTPEEVNGPVHVNEELPVHSGVHLPFPGKYV